MVPEDGVGFPPPVTVNVTGSPGTGLLHRFLSVAVTVCCAPTGFVADGGVRLIFVGGPTTQPLLAPPLAPEVVRASMKFVVGATQLVKANCAIPAELVVLVPPAGLGAPPPMTDQKTGVPAGQGAVGPKGGKKHVTDAESKCEVPASFESVAGETTTLTGVCALAAFVWTSE